MPRVPDELLSILTSFHREVVLPDMERIEARINARFDARFDDINTHFDEIYKRFDRLEKCLSSRPGSRISSAG